MKLFNKNMENVSVKEKKHRVLIFGERTCGTNPISVNHDSCNIEIICFPSDKYDELENLSDYELVILDYSVFLKEDQYGGYMIFKGQDIFEKQMFEALKLGTCFCILHYDDFVPSNDPYMRGCMLYEDVEKCRQSQIGFRFLDKFGIRPKKTDRPILGGQIKRNEFKNYMDSYGASMLYFDIINDEKISLDFIVELRNGLAFAFAIDVSRGKLIYIPCQRDFSRPKLLEKTFTTLVDSLITYLTKSRMELPKWAETPIFDEEEKLTKEKADLESKLDECQSKIDVFYSAKQLLFESEYGLEKALVGFIQEQCEIPIEREEKYNEDFWLLDPDLATENQKIAICEIKSYVKGFKKNGLYDLYNHRDSYKLGEEFPAVLFVNANLNAASWEQKDRTIDKQDYEEAAHKHILIVRIEDLLFIWQALWKNVLTLDELLDIFKHEAGWLNFKKDGSWRILK